MPEGPEIRRAADRVAKAVVGQPLTEVFFAFEELQAYQREFLGQEVCEIDTHGKAMLTHLSGGLTIYSHNQLYGRWYVTKPGSPPDTNRSLRVALRTEVRDALLYSASEVDVLDRDGLARHPFLSGLGPDALWPDLTWQEVDERLRSDTFSGRQLAAILLDQSFIAGLGNYLRAEILYAAGVEPTRRARDLERSVRQKLARRILSVTRRSYQTGGTTVTKETKRAALRSGEARRTARFAVFARDGKPCRTCAETILRDDVGGRRCYWCPSCQS